MPPNPHTNMRQCPLIDGHTDTHGECIRIGVENNLAVQNGLLFSSTTTIKQGNFSIL